MKEIPIALCGLGTVGSSVVKLLQEHKDILSSRLEALPALVQIGARRPNPNCDINDIEREADIFKVADDTRSKILVELIGGVDDAFELTMRAFAAQKDVISANKALIAEKGELLMAAAREHGVNYFYEAAVAGGIPIIKVLREGLVANRVTRIAGIINGTGNYILTAMAQEDKSFPDALQEAQGLGYAEADPTYDIDGTDSAHKIAILAALAFDIPFSYDRVYKEGITDIMPDDVNHAKELGYVIKHLAIAQLSSSDNGAEKISIRVHPTLVSKREEIAVVNGVTNGVMIDSIPLGRTFYSGAGAGGEATASAVLADLSDCIRGSRSGEVVSNKGEGNNKDNQMLNRNIDFAPIAEISSEFYLRVNVEDEAGVLAKITEILSSSNISIEGLHQKEHHPSQPDLVPVIIITHLTKEQTINQAIQQIEKIPQVVGKVIKLRILSE